ncbi:class I SAM-dependent methyltransferase [Rhabdochromatium marinum]|uniref:class I SAM-dependent methyltransferase n=1 Tax=Rhabdochromatium marinum TaxID=48729 RepID=UPI001903CD47|nr:class I SAM-dependent methyltransferase [Rhabdochromatium marinum]MBK1647102.1 hypothetical protein [Rhabdochromatium marinum]
MSISNQRASVLTGLIAAQNTVQHPRILVVGCGRGIEAAVLAQDLGADVIGLDLDPCFDPEAVRYARLVTGDATALEFDDGVFNIVYSYHALEHIPDYHKALEEMHRVLLKGGVWCIGTPNRARLVGYVGGNSTWREKFVWNWADWRMRLTGRFRNEQGAHAGYTSKELNEILLRHFSRVDEVTSDYYIRLYQRRKAVVSVLISSGLGRFLFPSVYFMGRK